MIEAYPLSWPAGHPRTPRNKVQGSRFSPVGRAHEAQNAINEIHRLGGRNVIISTNARLRRDGLPYSSDKTPDDRGVAVYFDYQGGQKCFPCDRWTTIEDNLRAIFKSIEAIRGLDRWGSKSFVDAAFTGFTALPAPVSVEPWFKVLGVSEGASLDEIQKAFRNKQMEAHQLGGDEKTMTALNVARDDGVRLNEQ